MLYTYDLHKNTDLKCVICRKKADILIVYDNGITEEVCLKCGGN